MCTDTGTVALEAEFPGWTVRSRRYLDGWSLSAWQGGTSTTARMPDVTRRTEAELREALASITSSWHQ
jgi:hypothetical protein